MAGGCRVPATCVSLADGVALAHPDGVCIGRDHGLPAIRRDCVSEAGLWRARWQVGCPGDELVGLHRTLPPERAALSVDPAKLFAFPVEKG